MIANLSDLQLKYKQQLEASGKAHATVVAYAKDIEQMTDFLAKKGKLEAIDVKAVDIDDFKDLLKKQRYTGKSISRKINSIKSFFRYVVNEGDLVNDISSCLN